ncbi:MAG: hypothetical protein LBF36_01345, partial [Mycoplasmataceae bacterium]|nr:hypothetical protein [Mycoplasmataceae bacterium]
GGISTLTFSLTSCAKKTHWEFTSPDQVMQYLVDHKQESSGVHEFFLSSNEDDYNFVKKEINIQLICNAFLWEYFIKWYSSQVISIDLNVTNNEFNWTAMLYKEPHEINMNPVSETYEIRENVSYINQNIACSTIGDKDESTWNFDFSKPFDATSHSIEAYEMDYMRRIKFKDELFTSNMVCWISFFDWNNVTFPEDK